MNRIPLKFYKSFNEGSAPQKNTKANTKCGGLDCQCGGGYSAEGNSHSRLEWSPLPCKDNRVQYEPNRPTCHPWNTPQCGYGCGTCAGSDACINFPYGYATFPYIRPGQPGPICSMDLAPKPCGSCTAKKVVVITKENGNANGKANANGEANGEGEANQEGGACGLGCGMSRGRGRGCGCPLGGPCPCRGQCPYQNMCPCRATLEDQIQTGGGCKAKYGLGAMCDNQLAECRGNNPYKTNVWNESNIWYSQQCACGNCGNCAGSGTVFGCGCGGSGCKDCATMYQRQANYRHMLTGTNYPFC